jgi:hypothetical protein
MESELRVYPNPFSSTTIVSANDNYEYSVCDLTGKTVQSGKIVIGENQLLLGTLNRGMYLLKLERNGKVAFIERIIKK